MQKIFSLLLFLAASLSAFGQTNIGDITVENNSKTIPIRVSASTSELSALAAKAFGAHGRYRVVNSGYVYDIAFSPAGANQVQVKITRAPGNTPVDSEVVSGTSMANALLRAGDIAVEKTNGQGLKGFFTATLAFISERTGKKEVYTSDLFFSPGAVRQITHDNALALMPRWAPDGEKIVYTSYKTGMPDIYLLKLTDNRIDTFVSYKGTNQGARFSPDGRRVAMVLSGTGTAEIWMSDALGHNPVRVTRSDAVKSSPCFSPDGSRLVFAMEPGPQLYVMPASGGTPQKLATGISYAAEPDWNRVNPNLIAFTGRVGTRYQVFVYDMATGKAEVVSKAQYDGVNPNWLPDGRHLVYTDRSASRSQIFVLDTVNGTAKVVSPSGVEPALEASVWWR